MKPGKTTNPDKQNPPRAPIQLAGEILAALWLFIVSLQYITRYYIIIPDIDYSIVYIIMLCVTAVLGGIKLAGYAASRRQRGK